MSVRETLARLNTPNVKFDIGRGGLPNLTPQDIAAAVGMIQGNPIGVGVMLWCYAPDCGLVGLKELKAEIAQRMRAQRDELERQNLVALLDHMLGEERWNETKRHDEDDHDQMRRLRASKDAAKRATWPRRLEVYPLIRTAVLDEIRAPRRCSVCDGTGHVMRDDLKALCDPCRGAGIVPISNRQRAERLKMDESTYRESWSKVYDWVMNLCRDECQRAERALGRRLYGDDDVRG